MRCLVAFDKFKGCLDAYAAGAACARGIRKALPHCLITVVPVADGGDGTTALIAAARGLKTIHVHATGATGERVTVPVALEGDTAWFDLASVCGLALVPPVMRNPLVTTTRGVGEVILALARAGVRTFNIGAGGSATVDGGRGALEALGFSFNGKADDTQVPDYVRHARFNILCDVRNPLNGPRGAACVFGPQKGASASDVAVLENRLEEFAGMMPAGMGSLERGGAAGGFAAGFAAFLGARLCDGAAVCLDAVGFDAAAADADVIVTGEGSIDATTLNGKGPGAVLARGLESGVPVYAVAGRVRDAEALAAAGFRKTLAASAPDAPEGTVTDADIAREKICKAAAQMFGSYEINC